MNITVSHRDLRDAVTRVARCVPTRTALPILHAIRFEAADGVVRLAATDLIIATTVTIPATIADAGVALIAADRLAALVPHLPAGDVTIATDGGTGTSLSAGSGDQRVRTRLNGHADNDYPALPVIHDAHQTVTLSAGVLRTGLEHALCSVSDVRDGREMLRAASLRLRGATLWLASSDGYRATRVELPCRTDAAPFDAIVHGAGVRELARLLTDEAADVDVHIGAGEALLVAETGDVRFGARLLDGTFPHIEQIVPRDRPTVVTVDRRAVRPALAVNMPFAHDNNEIVRLRATSIADGDDLDGLTVSARSAATGEASFQIGATITGPAAEVALDGRFFRAALAVGDDGDIAIGLADGHSPVTLRNGSFPGAVHCLMPMVTPKELV